jgi:putative endonuclease
MIALVLPRVLVAVVKRCVQWWDQLFPPRALGQRGEDAAVKFLKRRGYKIVGRGQRDQLGELDIIAVDRRTVVFVEVKTRTSAGGGGPHEAVTPQKQRKLANVALKYLRRHNLLEHAARFDVVAIIWPAHEKRPTIEHFVNAFEPPGQGQLFS